jgi:chorismate mutase
MWVRGIRGATTVKNNEEKEILLATTEMLLQIVTENQVVPEDICSVFVTTTEDLTATFPARAIPSNARLGACSPNVFVRNPC